MRHPISKVLFWLLVTVLVAININIHSIEGGRVLVMKEGLNMYLESSLQKGEDKPPSPNPIEPRSINQRNFAGGHTKFNHHYDRHDPHAPTKPRDVSALA